MSFSNFARAAVLGVATLASSFAANAQQTVHEFWQQNKNPDAGVTTGYEFYKQTVSQWLAANNIRQQNPNLAKKIEDFCLNAKTGDLSQGYQDFITQVAIIEKPGSPNAKYSQANVEQLIDVKIKNTFKDDLVQIKLPNPYVTRATAVSAVAQVTPGGN